MDMEPSITDATACISANAADMDNAAIDAAGFDLARHDHDWRASATVAPLLLASSQESMSRLKSIGVRSARSTPSTITRQSSAKTTTSLQSDSNPSPSPSPSKSRLSSTGQVDEPVFHNYMRAFYPFHPPSTMSTSTDANSITVPINMGDVILVHSVHPNGWADGTLLASGARGWLPTNYCEAYDHETIRSLLNALTQLWDLVRNNQVDNLAAFTRQDYVRAIIAGVRIFLEKTKCLNRDSELVQSHLGLRRLRKGLLGDLSALVKIAKRLQELVQSTAPTREIYEVLDELVLKAFRVVIRAVRFLDIWSQDVPAESPSTDASGAPWRPPTLSSDTQTVSMSEADVVPHAVAAIVRIPASSPSGRSRNASDLSKASLPVHSPIKSSSPSGSVTKKKSIAARRLSKYVTVSHRSSYTGKPAGVRSQNLASERLNAAHDQFLGFIGSFIGLHLHSRSSTDLLHITQQSVIASRKLLVVADEVWERDGRRSSALEHAKDTMYSKLEELVQATKDVLSPSPTEDDVFMPNQGKQLVLAATSCVRAAGDCVSKTRTVVELIGDFEFDATAIGLPDSPVSPPESTDVGAEQSEKAGSAKSDTMSVQSVDKPLPLPPQLQELPPPAALLPTVRVDSKPLPEPPLPSPLPSPNQTLEDINVSHSREPSSTITPNIPETIPEITSEPAAESNPEPTADRLSKSSLDPGERSDSPFIAEAQFQSPTESLQRSSIRTSRFGKGLRSDSVNDSVAETSSTHRSSIRDDGASVMSTNSTRATTPDRSPITAHNADSTTALGSFGSVSELNSMVCEDVSGVEEAMFECSFAHELVYNKEGQITGGSLPALVEKLTTHDSTPDATFVNIFYLTFRLFTTPTQFAQCLIDRFDHVSASSKVSVPVRLRVYNVFKGWLESHWQSDTDSAALSLIWDFANGKLKAVLPAPSKRLDALTAKVSEPGQGSIVPRLVSSIGKTRTSTTSFSANDAQIPHPIVSKGQLNALRQAHIATSPCSILDFDPLELARQFTIIESQIFCSIGPEELVGSEWTKKASSKAVNVRAMSTLSTDLANLVADTILHLEEAKKRALMIKQWVKIAARCVELQNYDSLMAIICSLNSSMVLRLKRTWEQISPKTKAKYEELVGIVDVGRNYAVLRQRLQNQVAPCIPFVGMYLTDLTFVDVGNQATRQLRCDGTGEGLSVINFDKHMKTARIIGQMQRFQAPYRLAAVPEMQDWIKSQFNRVRVSDQANMQSYYRRSLFLEPREAPSQKPSPVERLESFATLSGEKEKFDLWATVHLKRSEKPSLHQRQPSNSNP